MTRMQAPPGWYPDPSVAGTVRYWSGQEWTFHTAPGMSSTSYSTPAPAAFWPSQPGAWTDGYGAAGAMGGRQQGLRTAAIVTLSIILAVLALVIIAEVSHVLTVSRENSAPAAPFAPYTYSPPTHTPPNHTDASGQLPAGVAALSLDPASYSWRHPLNLPAEAGLAPSGSALAIGYYKTAAGSIKVFTETINVRAEGDGAGPEDLLAQLEGGVDGSISLPNNAGRQLLWSPEPTGVRTALMSCASYTEYDIPVRACVFVQGTTFGVIGVDHPVPADGDLFNELRREITGS